MLLISSAPLAVQICSFPKEHGLKNWQQTRYTICVWRRLGVRYKRLGVVKGVGRGASPRRLKNIDPVCRTLILSYFEIGNISHSPVVLQQFQCL